MVSVSRNPAMPRDSRQKGPSNHKLASTTPYQLRSLVFDYFCHHCYTSTARAFIKDSAVRHLDADGDEIRTASTSSSNDLSEDVLVNVERREKIRSLILSGRVDEAIELLNEQFPSVLSGPAAGHASTAAHQDQDYVAATSVDPAHLLLNLRILSFIEACRTVALPYSPTPTAASEAMVDSPPPPMQEAQLLDDQSSQQQLSLLLRAQKLHALASNLPDENDRAVYQKELNNVGGLLAYKVPENSSIASYMSQERREAVAEQINSAILHRTGARSVSSLELITRYTLALWSFAHQHGVKPRGGVILPPSGTLPDRSSSDISDKDQQVVSPLDLQQFLDSKR